MMQSGSVTPYYSKVSPTYLSQFIVVFSILLYCLLFSACDNKITSDNVNVKAECVSVYHEGKGNYTYIGTLKYTLNPQADLIYSPLHPSVWIFRSIPKDFEEKDFKVGGAYLDLGSDFEYLGMVDVNLSDEELAKIFSVNLDDLLKIDKKDNTGSGKYILRVAGDRWQKFGIFVHKRHQIIEERSIKLATRKSDS